MARFELSLPENVPGEVFVDSTCIDCDTCRQVCPSVFAQSARSQSFVHHQPESPEELQRALMALVACPTASIGTVHKQDVRRAAASFPELIAKDVYYCGFTSESSFGASSYLIVRKDGNVLVDSPRAAGPLLEKIAEMGGVSILFLTHRDDVADHERLRERFGCERILHAADVAAGTRGVERRVEGRERVPLAPDLVAIPLPGHTRGSMALLFRDSFLFTGDHLAGTEDGRGLEAWPSVCWYSWEEQTRSMERLLAERFEHVLPGHGRRHDASSPEDMRRKLEKLVAWMKGAKARR